MIKILKDRQLFYKNLPISERREWNTLFIIYPFAAIMLLLYFLKYNFLYHVSEYNIYFYSLAILLVLIVSFGLLSKQKKLAFKTYLFALTLAVLFLTFVSGGIRAPGLSWLTLFGPVYGLFFGKRGIYFGMFLSVVVFISLFFLDKYGLNPNVVLNHAIYQTEKNSNFFTFLFFMGANFLAYAIAYERAAKDLAEKNEEIEVFLRILFHDVANPLAVVILSSDKMIKRSEFNEEGVLRIKKAASNIREQLESVKKLKAVKDGKFLLDINEYNLDQMINESVDVFAEKCLLKDLKIITKFGFEKVRVRVDYVVFVNQVISNILSNSIKFSHQSSEVIIQITSDENAVQVSIKDFGIGMSEEIKNQLFEVNKSKSRTGTNSEVGSGYGLSIAKHFVESFQGTIQVRSVEQTEFSKEHGTNFIISLPKIK